MSHTYPERLRDAFVCYDPREERILNLKLLFAFCMIWTVELVIGLFVISGGMG